MDLKWSLFTRALRPHPQLRVKLQQKLGKLTPLLEELQIAPETVHLKVSLEKHEKKKWYRAVLRFQAPCGVLRCEQFSNDPLIAFDDSLEMLTKDLSGLKSLALFEQQPRNPMFLEQAVIVPAAQPPGVPARAAP